MTLPISTMMTRSPKFPKGLEDRVIGLVDENHNPIRLREEDFASLGVRVDHNVYPLSMERAFRELVEDDY